MSRGEVLELLAGEPWMVLGTLDPDGSPWADLVGVELADGALTFRVPRASRSFANLRRDPRACCAIDRFPSYYEIRGLTVHGRAEAIGDGESFRLLLDDVFSFDFGKIERRF